MHLKANPFDQVSEKMKNLASFERKLHASPDPIATLQNGEIGKGLEIDTPFGRKPLIYADYVASGRALVQIEDFVRDHVLPYYANSHTEQSFCGATMTRMREEARQVIAQKCGAIGDEIPHIQFGIIG